MTQHFDRLSDEEQIGLASEYVAMSVTLPEQLRAALFKKGLLELVLNPQGDFNDSN